MQATLSTITTRSIASGAHSFSMARFLAYFKLFISSNSRKLLLSCAMIFIATFALDVFAIYTSGYYLYGSIMESPAFRLAGFDPMWTSMTDYLTFLFIVFATIAGSRMYNAVSSRRERLETMEIPASQLEKFLTWWIVYVPMFLIVTFLCFYLAEIVRVLWIKAFTDFSSMAHIMPLKNMLTLKCYAPDAMETYTNNDIFTIAMCFYSAMILNSIFAAGSAFFPRLSYLKTVGMLFIIFVIITILSNIGFHVFFDGDFRPSTIADTDNISTTVYFGIFTLIASAYFYWLSYRRYREMEVIDRW